MKVTEIYCKECGCVVGYNYWYTDRKGGDDCTEELGYGNISTDDGYLCRDCKKTDEDEE